MIRDAIDQAIEELVIGAAALAQRTQEGKALALLRISRAMLRIAESDPMGGARDMALEALAEVKEKLTP